MCVHFERNKFFFVETRVFQKMTKTKHNALHIGINGGGLACIVYVYIGISPVSPKFNIRRVISLVCRTKILCDAHLI